MSEDEYKTITEKFRYVMINTFQMFRCVCRISQYRKLLWWIHEPSEFYINIINSETIEILNNINYTNVVVKAVSGIAKDNFIKNVRNIENSYLQYGIPDVCSEIFGKSENDPIVIGVIGTVYERKGQDILLEALELLNAYEMNSIKVLIIGNIVNNRFCNEIRKRAEMLVNVEIMGLLNRQQIDEIEARIDVFAVPSREDPLPISVTEGLMHGKICLVSSNTGFSDIIKSFQNGLIFESENKYDLADKIRWILHNKDRLKSIGESGRKLYDAIFSMNVFEDNLLRTLESI